MTPSLSPSPSTPGPATTPSAALPAFRALRVADLRALASAHAGWLWHGYLAPGNVTLLTSQWKSGKTTLLAVLLARLKAGGVFAGLPLRPGRAVVVSEESAEHWAPRCDRLDLDGHVWWLCRPFRSKPRPEDWLALVDYLAKLGQEHALDLVVIDPLAAFYPGKSENDAAAMMEVLLPLQRLTTRGLSILVLHHPGRGERRAGQAARGSGALAGHVDILLEMGWQGEPSADDRRRRLVAYSRHPETPRRRVIELTADGTDYESRGDFTDIEFAEGWEMLRRVLEHAPRRLTLQEIRRHWLPGVSPPPGTTLWRWLDRALADGRLRRKGTGRRKSPYRYWLPAKEAEWDKDPLHPDRWDSADILDRLQGPGDLP